MSYQSERSRLKLTHIERFYKDSDFFGEMTLLR